MFYKFWIRLNLTIKHAFVAEMCEQREAKYNYNSNFSLLCFPNGCPFDFNFNLTRPKNLQQMDEKPRLQNLVRQEQHLSLWDIESFDVLEWNIILRHLNGFSRGKIVSKFSNLKMQKFEQSIHKNNFKFHDTMTISYARQTLKIRFRQKIKAERKYFLCRVKLTHFYEKKKQKPVWKQGWESSVDLYLWK